jgi:hypothetical protein
MRPVIAVPRGSTVFPSTLTGCASLAEKASPLRFLSVLRVWRTVALIFVPFGKVTRWSGCVAWVLAPGLAGLTGAALLVVRRAACAGWLLATVAGCSASRLRLSGGMSQNPRGTALRPHTNVVSSLAGHSVCLRAKILQSVVRYHPASPAGNSWTDPRGMLSSLLGDTPHPRGSLLQFR